MRRKYRTQGNESISVAEDGISRHRNGVCGLGFWTVEFTDKRTLHIAQLDDDGHVSVIRPDDLTFHLRGHDWYGPAVRSAIVSAYKREFPYLSTAQVQDEVPSLQGA